MTQRFTTSRPGCGLPILAALSLWGATVCAQTPTAAPLPAAGATASASPAQATSEPLTQDQAVALAMAHSPSLQALLADSQARQERLQADAQPALLRWSFARLKQGDEHEIDRSLSLSLFEWLTWPWRAKAARSQIGVLQQQLAIDTLRHAEAVRGQWIVAVASQQKALYLDDVADAAEVSSTLAERLHASGQFSAAQTAQERFTAAEARQTALKARQQAIAEREALIRLVGLQADEARHMRLPERLPDVPAQLPWQADQVTTRARQERLDLRLAQARWQAMQHSLTDTRLRSLLDMEAGWQQQSFTSQPRNQGPEISFSVLAADLGTARRAAASADEQAALAQWQQTVLAADSQVRESWAAYVNAHEAAVHAREVLAPVRQHLLDERLKQYNGMLIGPLELLAEARAHIASVIDALDAQRDYHLADLGLRMAIEGSAAPTLSSARP
jgi:outer membrane protein TolC